jgi:hypothetical protein
MLTKCQSLYTYPQLIFTTNLRGKYNYPHFADEERKYRRARLFAKAT